ncbi:hypothetical protein EV179_004874 [Coemansia sp. RSA 487]|nr:hypothetical protein EV179_004874 [Coemansia sp. RSA 487]
MKIRPRAAIRMLRLSWVLLLFIGEVGLYYWHISRCQWPTNGTKGTNISQVAIIADPQIVDHYSYGQSGLLLRITQFFTDIYIRKSYLLLQDIRSPATVIFLGDLMDGGREWDDSAWLSEYHGRYQSIFSNRDPANRRVYDMAGNHDIGIGNTIIPEALQRFHRYVGPTNQVIDVGGHSIVLLDTLTLESDDPVVSSSSRHLVQWLQDERIEDGSVLPRLLFTHVPMWRPDKTPCGSLRQSKHPYLLNRRGYQFRDQLFQNTTEHLLDAIQPAAIFSGDDHDTCTVEHQIHATERSVPEYTIGAFGWASGVPIASYGLLTLYHSSQGNQSFILQHCYLPYQLGIYKCYASSFAFSLLLLAYACWCQRKHHWNGSDDERVASGRSDAIEQGWRVQQQQSLLPTASSGQYIYPRGIKRRLALDVLRGASSVALVAVPSYIAFILLFYIV